MHRLHSDCYRILDCSRIANSSVSGTGGVLESVICHIFGELRIENEGVANV